MTFISYNGVALTTIDVIEDPEGSGKVLFNGAIDGDVDKVEATFLNEIKISTVKDKEGNPYMEAKKLTVEEAKKIICEEGRSDPLFSIHGFWTEPEDYLGEIAAIETNRKFNIIPVLWPSVGGLLKGYNTDRERAQKAGENLKIIKDKIDEFGKKSLLCHSMGNFVLRFAADHKFKFDNIFMVAADVRHDIFWQEYIDDAKDDQEKDEYDGMHIFKMLNTTSDDKPKGKIYVLHNHRDIALAGSATIFKNGITRLGQVGAYKKKGWFFGGWKEDKDLIHHDLRGYVESHDSHEADGLFTEHGYQFSEKSINFYESKKISSS